MLTSDIFPGVIRRQQSMHDGHLPFIVTEYHDSKYANKESALDRTGLYNQHLGGGGEYFGWINHIYKVVGGGEGGGSISDVLTASIKLYFNKVWKMLEKLQNCIFFSEHTVFLTAGIFFFFFFFFFCTHFTSSHQVLLAVVWSTA